MVTLPSTSVPVNILFALPLNFLAQDQFPVFLSRRFPHHCSEPALSSLLSIVRKPFSSSVFAFSDKLSLLPPRSARLTPPLYFTIYLLRCTSAPLPINHASAVALAPSIFGAAEFHRYVATRFLPDADFHGHRPIVLIHLHPSRLCHDIWCLIAMQGSFLFASPAYQNSPTTLAQVRNSSIKVQTTQAHSQFVRHIAV